jgi:hypothetical protein
MGRRADRRELLTEFCISEIFIVVAATAMVDETRPLPAGIRSHA